MSEEVHRYISIDGCTMERASSHVSARRLYGSGVFTTVVIRDGEPWLWTKHWRRLLDNAAAIRLNIPDFSEDSAREVLLHLSEANNVRKGRARVTFYDESESPIWGQRSDQRSAMEIVTGDIRPRHDRLLLTISPFAVNASSPLTGIKSCNYLEKILALDESKRRGFHEAIQVNERVEIVSTCMANIFWLKEERLYTPSLKTGCLPGTTREYVLENLECTEVDAPIDELHSADEIFLTSAGLGVVQVAEFDGQKLKRHHHPILDLLPSR